MAKDPTLKKKRKSEAMLDAAAPAEGSTSAQAVVAEVDSAHAEKKAKKEKKSKKSKDADGDVTMATEAGDVTVDESSKKKEKKEKVSFRVRDRVIPKLTFAPRPPLKSQQKPSPRLPTPWPTPSCKRSSSRPSKSHPALVNSSVVSRK
jgi:hypothetical protein